MILDINPSVAAALKENRAVVALESTIISHGMPYPDNYRTATQLEQIVSNNGAVPATIAVIDGKIKIGLTHAEIEYLSTAKNVGKLSRRDIAACIAGKGNGATTVAATMIFARLAGIKVFATGGIGGVHRNAAQTMDISADLEELAQTPVIVVCSGVKSILDIPKTLEYLETKGVPVFGYKTDRFPAFYLSDSGRGVDCNADEQTIADAFAVSQELGLKGGFLVGCPVPEEAQADSDLINQAISTALDEAEQAGIAGKSITPFLLGRIAELTKGSSLRTNIALVKNNAAVASRIALRLAANNR